MNKGIAGILLFCLLTCGFQSSLHAQWVQLNGPEGGWMWNLAVSGGQLILGTDAGGIYRTSDDGVTWHKANEGLTSWRTTALAASGTHVFVGTGRGIFRSNDGGSTWKPIDDGLTGTSWEILNDGITGTMAKKFVFIDSTVFVVVLSIPESTMVKSYAVFKAAINGHRWSKVADPPGGVGIEELVAKDGVLYAGSATYPVRYFRSTDEGLHWIECADDKAFPDMEYEPSASCGKVTLKVIWPSDAGPWTPPVGPWVNVYGTHQTGIARGLCAYNNKFFIGADHGVFCTEDSGKSWLPRMTGISAADIGSVYVEGSTLMIEANGGFFRTTDLGNTWVHETDTIGYVQRVIGSIGHYLYASGVRRGYYFRSTDQGVTWSSQAVPQGKGPDQSLIIRCIAGNHLIGEMKDGIYVSVDTGGTWVKTDTDGWENHVELSVERNEVFVAIRRGGFLLSSDGGLNWKRIHGVEIPNMISEDVCLLDHRLFVQADSELAPGKWGPSYLYRSDDNGASWKQFPWVDGQLVGRKQGLFTIWGSKNLYSKDGGEHWIDISDGLLCSAHVIATTDSEIFIGTEGSGIWRRTFRDIEQQHQHK